MKREKRKPTADYPVGYCRPPEHTQFKPGHERSSNGRPKGARNARTIATEVFLRRKVSVTENGKLRRVPVFEAMVLRIAERALSKEDPRALLAALSVMQRAGLLTEIEASAIQESLTAENEELVTQYLASRGVQKIIPEN